MNNSFQLSQSFLDAVKNCNKAQKDALFGILKYRDIGILRKTHAFAEILNLSKQETTDLIESLPKTSDGRVLDLATRTALCEALTNKKLKHV